MKLTRRKEGLTANEAAMPIRRPPFYSSVFHSIPCTWKFSRDEIFANFANDIMFANI